MINVDRRPYKFFVRYQSSAQNLAARPKLVRELLVSHSTILTKKGWGEMSIVDSMPRPMVAVIAAIGATVALSIGAQADTLSLYYDATVASGPAGFPTVYQATSLQSTPYPAVTCCGGAYITLTTPLAVNALTTLEADYEMTEGTFGGGAPRFSLVDQSGNEAYIYFGSPTGGGSFSDPNIGSITLNSTGNYADLLSSDVRVYSNGFDGLNTSNTGTTWSTFVADVGSADIAAISLDLDGGFTGNQQIDFDNININGEIFAATQVPEPASLALLGAGLLGLAGFKARRRRA